MTSNSITTIVLNQDNFETWFANRRELIGFVVKQFPKDKDRNCRVTLTIETKDLTPDEVGYFKAFEAVDKEMTL